MVPENRDTVGQEIALLKKKCRILRTWVLVLTFLIPGTAALAGVFAVSTALLTSLPRTAPQTGPVILRDARGVQRARLALSENGVPSLTFFDGLGKIRLLITLTSTGEGSLETWREQGGMLIVREAVLAEPASTGTRPKTLYDSLPYVPRNQPSE